VTPSVERAYIKAVRLLHLSDLHLGFRQFQRTTQTGINQREADVADVFRHVIDQAIALQPELIVVAGDVFHTVRPTNPAIIHAFLQFQRLMQALPHTDVVMVAGNHDMPRSSETTCILRLFRPLGIHVVDTEPRRLTLRDGALSVLAVPDLPPHEIHFDQDPAARFNVLLVHGEVEDTIPRHTERVGLTIPRTVLEDPKWDYIALGDYHVYKQLAPKAFYCGAMEYTSTNPWGEIAEEQQRKLPGKRIIEWDLETSKLSLHKIKPVREFLDLAPIDGRGMSAADLDGAIAAAVAAVPGGIDGKVVRLVARDVPRHVARELDHKALREYQRRALQFHLDTRRPEALRREAGSGAPGRRPSLDELLADHLRSRKLTSDIDREAMVRLGMHYLHEAEQAGVLREAPSTVEEG
jgi:exonuclease SbcD